MTISLFRNCFQEITVNVHCDFLILPVLFPPMAVHGRGGWEGSPIAEYGTMPLAGDVFYQGMDAQAGAGLYGAGWLYGTEKHNTRGRK